MATGTSSVGGSVREGRQAQEGALKTALEIRNRQVKLLTEENGKLKGKLSQVRKELDVKEEDSQRLNGEMDKLIQQLVTATAGGSGTGQGSQEGLEAVSGGNQVTRGWVLQRLKEELEKDDLTDGKRFRKAVQELVHKKREDDVLRKELRRAKEQLEEVRKDFENQLRAMKEKEKKLEGDFQRIRDELAGKKKELKRVRKQLGEEEELRKGSEFKLKSIRESIKMIDEVVVGSITRGFENEAGQGSLRTPSRAGGGEKDNNKSSHIRSASGKHRLPSSPPSTLESSKKKSKLEAKAGSSRGKSIDSPSGDEMVRGTIQHSLDDDELDLADPVPCITIDSDSDSDDGLGATQNQTQRAPVGVGVAPSVALPARAPVEGADFDLFAEVRGPIPTTASEIAHPGSDDDPSPSPRDIDYAEETEPMEFGVPDVTVLQHSTLNRNATRRRKSRNGKKYSVTPRRVSKALTRLLRHGEAKGKPLYCICGNRFASRRSLCTHVYYFNRREPKRCDICKKFFTTLYNLNCHKNTVHLNPDRRNPTNKSKLPRRRMRPEVEAEEIAEISRGKEDTHGFSHEVSPGGGVSSSSGNGNGSKVPPRPGTSSSSPRSGATQYFCKCGQQFPSNDAFLEHMSKTKLKGRFKCCWCPVGFQKRQNLRHHQRKYHAVALAQNELKRKSELNNAVRK